MKIQCGYESDCKAKDCFHCRRFLKLKTNTISLAEATCIEDFGTVDLVKWDIDKPEQIDLAQDIIRKKLYKRVDWDG